MIPLCRHLQHYWSLRLRAGGSRHCPTSMLPAATAAHLQQAARPSPVATPPSSPPTKLVAVVFPFSHVTKNGECAHRSPNVTLSFDRLTAAVAKGCAGGWARAECGITSGCGVVRWMVQLCSDREGHGRWLMLGVASERFDRFSGIHCSSK